MDLPGAEGRDQVNVALRPEHLNILSICTGGAGLDLGVELAVPSARTVCMVEREAFAVAQLVSAMETSLMAPAPIWSDARTFDGRVWRGAVDGLIGGIPCQPHSLAGKKGGQNDERDLWSDARRIIVQSRAWFVLIENVAGMLSAGDDEIAGAERVYRDLRKLGFEVEGGLFTASEVGASHERERIFIFAVADRVSQGLERCDRREIRQQQPPVERSGEDLVNPVSIGRSAWRNDNGSDVRHEFGPAGQHALEHTEGFGWREGRPEPILWSWWDAAAVTGNAVANSSIARGRGISVQPRRQDKTGSDADWPSSSYLFPPGPNDRKNWQAALERAPELEPAFRRVADGLASRLDIARVDRIRLLGNGVVCLEAAYAFRTLITRLAARGSAGAARLVRMMEI